MNQTHAAVVFLLHFLTIFSFLTLSQLAMKSDGRYLRPADHGLLTYQNSTTNTPTRDDKVPPQQQQQQQMSSFFNGGKPIPVQSSSLPLPEAKNITTTTTGGGVDVVNDDRWKRRIRSRDNGSGNHLKEILLVASLVCGVAGMIFLAVSGVIFLVRCRKERSVSQSTLALTGGAAGVTNKL